MAGVGPVFWGRCVIGAMAALVWGCAMWRVALGEGGPVAASVAAGGWGISLLPVHAAAVTGHGKIRTRAFRGTGGKGRRGLLRRRC